MRSYFVWIILASATLVLAGPALAAHPEPAQFVSAGDGARIAYYPLLQAKTVPVLVLSGGPGSDSSYMRARGALDQLARTRSVVFYDQRGTSESSDSDGGETIDKYVGDIEAVRKAVGAPKVDLLGHSFGGYLAIAYASRYPQHVRGLVFVDSAAPKLGDVTQLMEQVFPERIGEWRAKRATLGKRVTAADVAVFQSMEFVDDVALREFLDAVKDHGSNMDVNNTLREDMAGRDYWDGVRGFEQHALVVHGRFDAIVAPSNSWALHQALPSSTFHIIEAAGHLPHIERPEAFLAAVKPFLESLDHQGALRLESCNREGISPPAKCGTFTVWENRDTKAGRTIDLNVVLLEATGPDREPDPFVYVTGGPGEAATSAAVGLSAHEVRKERDILLMDVRGTGRSNGLYCQPGKTAPLQEFMPLMDVPRTRACRKELEKQADLRYYLTSHAMDDLDDLRAALGYEQINIEAGSHGTLVALVYIRRHGEHVRSATLMAATALSHPMPLHFATDTEGSLRNVLRDCAAEPACAAAFPAVEDDYRRVVRRINEDGPMRIEVRDPRNGPRNDPRNDKSVAVSFTATDFAESLRAMLYTPETIRSVPALLHHAATTGDYRVFAEFQLERNMSVAEGIAKGQYFAVTCTEDIARVDPKAVYAAGRGTFLDDHRARPHIESCEGWPLGRLPAGFGEEVQSDVPVLIVNGESDPATPPASARAAASRLSNARVLIVPQGSHNMEGLTGVECVEGVVARFLTTADPQGLDTACIANIRRKPFILKPAEIR